MRNLTKIDENSIKKLSKKYQKSMKMMSMGRPGATLGVFGVILVASDRSGPYFGSNLDGLGAHLGSKRVDPGPFWAPSWGSKCAKIGSKSDPKRYPLDDRFED